MLRCLTILEATRIYHVFLQIITLRFTWGERKAWSNIKKYQNIMIVIVCVLNILLWNSAAPCIQTACQNAISGDL